MLSLILFLGSLALVNSAASFYKTQNAWKKNILKNSRVFLNNEQIMLHCPMEYEIIEQVATVIENENKLENIKTIQQNLVDALKICNNLMEQKGNKGGGVVATFSTCKVPNWTDVPGQKYLAAPCVFPTVQEKSSIQSILPTIHLDMKGWKTSIHDNAKEFLENSEIKKNCQKGYETIKQLVDETKGELHEDKIDQYQKMLVNVITRCNTILRTKNLQPAGKIEKCSVPDELSTAKFLKYRVTTCASPPSVLQKVTNFVSNIFSD